RGFHADILTQMGIFVNATKQNISIPILSQTESTDANAPATHSSASIHMKNVAFTRNVAHEPIAHAKALFEIPPGCGQERRSKILDDTSNESPLPADGAPFYPVA